MLILTDRAKGGLAIYDYLTRGRSCQVVRGCAARNQFARLTKWEADGGMSFGGMSRSLLKFAERTLLFKSYAASAI